MKKLFFSISLLVFSSSLIAQDSNPNYFHDLSGFEDSTGTTQLFYRLSETYTVYIFSWYRENHVRHFNTVAQSDSIIFYSTEKDWGLPGYAESVTVDYDFYTNSPSNWIQLSTPYEGSSPNIQDYRSKSIEFAFGVLLKTLSKKKSYTWPANLVIHPSVDSIYTILDSHITIPFSKDTSMWPIFGDDYDAMIDYFDSTHFDYELLSIHPTIDSLYFGVNSSGHLFRSEQYSAKFEFADASVNYAYNSELIFDQNPNYIYSKKDENLLISDNQGRENSWGEISLPDELNRLLYVTTDTSISGSLFIADSNSVYHSTNFGSTFDKLLGFESQVTGLYKKPNSDILYVLTKTDLYKVENGQPTSIKQVPVSNEESPEIPTSVSLKQNYPNPFNPTTTIQFELDKSTFTKLTVFDVLGRKVRELVNEVRSAGTNSIQFDATNLASGVYLYRLEANGIVQTKKLTLIK